MAKNSPIATRTSRMAYCSKPLLPCSANCTNGFQSISLPPLQYCQQFSRASVGTRFGTRLCFHPLDPLRAKCRSRKWIRKVLCLPRNLVAVELHDAHGVRRLAVISQNEFGDPKITAANDSSDSKPLTARLTRALTLYVVSSAGSLARLRIVQHRVFVIDQVLGYKIVGIGRRPMLIQRRTNLLISRSRTLLRLLWIVHLETPIRQ